MKQLLFTNWHFMRFLRVALALFLFYNAYQTHEWFFIVFGIFFLFQAVFNMGCGPNGCNVNYDKKELIMNTTFQEIIDSEKPVLIDFYGSWCGPCQMLGPILKQVKDSLGERISIIKIDVDKNQELAAMHNVRGVPTMMLYQKGEQLWRQSGVLSKEEIIQIILDKTN